MIKLHLTIDEHVWSCEIDEPSEKEKYPKTYWITNFMNGCSQLLQFVLEHRTK